MGGIEVISNKLNPQLQLSLRYERLLSQDFKNTFIVDERADVWEIVMEYTGDLDSLRTAYSMTAYDLQGGFAQIFIAKQQIGNLSNHPNVIYLSLPKRMAYIDIGLNQVCATNLSTPTGPFFVTGENVLLSVIDTGINYRHPDFINEQGETRIQYIWDQTIESQLPDGYSKGTIYTASQINEALKQPTLQESLEIVPSVDENGHGTALAGIAAGNGRGSIGLSNRGVAPGCELIIVKLGHSNTSYPRDIDVMQGIHYAIQTAKELNKPLVILLGVGSNLSGHNGTAPLELYISRRSNNWLINFVVGTGNQGDKASHEHGQVMQRESEIIQLTIEGNQMEYACTIWKSFSDEISLVIQAPNGEKTDVLSLLTPNRAYLFDQTAVMINFSEPVVDINRQEIFILFQGQSGAAVNNGIWTLTLIGTNILEGGYNIWGAIVTESSNRVRFLNSEIDMTLTTPSTAEKITSAAAYNGVTQQLTSFSGRGFTVDGRVMPSITAPGINITVPSINEESLYTTITGTSAASAFVAGAYVLMQSYGIFQLNNVNAYGESLKVYLLRTARRPTGNAPYPNTSWGYGLLCIEAALNYMKEINS